MVLVGATNGSFAQTKTRPAGFEATAMLLKTSSLGASAPIPAPSVASHEGPISMLIMIIAGVSAVALLAVGCSFFALSKRRRILARSRVGGTLSNPESVGHSSPSLSAQPLNSGRRSKAAASNVQSGTILAPRKHRANWTRRWFLPNAKTTGVAVPSPPEVLPPLPSYESVTGHKQSFKRSNARVGIEVDDSSGHSQRVIEGSMGSSPSESKEPLGETWIADNGRLGTTPDDQRGRWELSSPDCVPKPGIAEAMLRAAQEVAHSSMVPGLSDAAAIVSVLVNLAVDTKETRCGGEKRLRWCWSLVTLLKRADDLLGEVCADF